MLVKLWSKNTSSASHTSSANSLNFLDILDNSPGVNLKILVLVLDVRRAERFEFCDLVFMGWWVDSWSEVEVL